MRKHSQPEWPKDMRPARGPGRPGRAARSPGAPTAAAPSPPVAGCWSPWRAGVGVASGQRSAARARHSAGPAWPSRWGPPGPGSARPPSRARSPWRSAARSPWRGGGSSASGVGVAGNGLHAASENRHEAAREAEQERAHGRLTCGCHCPLSGIRAGWGEYHAGGASGAARERVTQRRGDDGLGERGSGGPSTTPARARWRAAWSASMSAGGSSASWPPARTRSAGQQRSEALARRREERRREEATARALRDLLGGLDALAATLTAATLAAAGYHRHDRGPWRKRRECRTAR